jgi:hypothetical protein
MLSVVDPAITPKTNAYKKYSMYYGGSLQKDERFFRNVTVKLLTSFPVQLILGRARRDMGYFFLFNHRTRISNFYTSPDFSYVLNLKPYPRAVLHGSRCPIIVSVMAVTAYQ